MSTEKNIAKHLLDIKAVFLKPNDPFTWASGIKAPIYCDNRLTLSYPEVRDDVEHAIAEIIKTYYPQCEAVMGTSTAGIAHAAFSILMMLLDETEDPVNVSSVSPSRPSPAV